MKKLLSAVTRRAAVPGVVAAAVLLTSLTPALSASPASAVVGTSTTASTPLAVKTTRAKAEKTLARAQRLLAVKTPAAARKQALTGRDASMVLRKLWLQRDALSPADRAQALQISKRPTDTDQVACSLTCVHWNSAETTAADAASTLATMDYVQASYINAGYRPAKPDDGLGGNDLPDVYLDDIGSQGLYGYCTTDQKKSPGKGRFDVWAFCVLDNDFSAAEFPTNTPLENRQVTAAHEYFHATQYAYDAAEDGWLLESLAAWVEDQLYPDVNDNVQYLRQSVINKPQLSLDKGSGIGIYGSWIWIRYLSEKYPTLQGPLPKIVLDIFNAFDSSKGAKKDEYSIQAIKSVLAKKGGFSQTFAKFSAANRDPAANYAEGSLYPSANLAKNYKLKGGARAGGTARLNHQSALTVRFTPQKALKKKSAQLNLSLDLASKQSAAAVVTTYLKDGQVKTTVVKLNGRGNASKRFGFSAKKVKYLELTMVNTSTRYRGCYQRQTPFACSGQPVDQAVAESFRAVVQK